MVCGCIAGTLLSQSESHLSSNRQTFYSCLALGHIFGWRPTLIEISQRTGHWSECGQGDARTWSAGGIPQGAQKRAFMQFFLLTGFQPWIMCYCMWSLAVCTHWITHPKTNHSHLLYALLFKMKFTNINLLTCSTMNDAHIMYVSCLHNMHHSWFLEDRCSALSHMTEIQHTEFIKGSIGVWVGENKPLLICWVRCNCTGIYVWYR